MNTQSTESATYTPDNIFKKMWNAFKKHVTSKEFKYAEVALSTSVEMKDLKVVDVYTTRSDNDNSNGAMTLTCQANGVTLDVRTIVLTDDNGQIITADAYRGKTIDVKGIVDCYNGEYQIKVMDDTYITVH